MSAFSSKTIPVKETDCEVCGMPRAALNAGFWVEKGMLLNQENLPSNAEDSF